MLTRYEKGAQACKISRDSWGTWWRHATVTARNIGPMPAAKRADGGGGNHGCCMSYALWLIIVLAGTRSAPIVLEYHSTSAALHHFEVADNNPQLCEAAMAFCAGCQFVPVRLCIA